MTEERKQELRQLLNEATTKENLEIWYEHGQGKIYGYKKSIPVDEYQKYLQQRWASYSTEPMGFSSDVKPHIASEVTKSKLLGFIREELDASIEGNSVYSASYAIEGNHADGFRLENTRSGGVGIDGCLYHLLKIAIVCGVEEAVSVFERSSRIEGSQGYFQSVASLEGIRLESEIQVFEGVRLVTVPDPASGPVPAVLLPHMPDFLFLLARESEFSARGKTLLVIDCPVYSICHKSSQEMFYDERPINDVPFKFSLEGEKFTDRKADRFFVRLFCQALSLACNSAVQRSGTGWLFPEEEFFHPGNGGVSLSRSRGQFGDATFGEVAKVGETEINEAKCLYKKLIDLDSGDSGKKVQISCDRWLKSKTPRNPIDQIIDLGIAFESLYVPDGGRGEIRFKFAVHAAWHLGKDHEDRKALMEEFKKIYDWRSKVVHTGKLPNKEVDKIIERAQDLCRQSIMKILEDGKFPDWNSLILGDEAEGDVEGRAE